MVSLFLSFCLSFFSRRRQESRQYNTDRGAVLLLLLRPDR